LVPEPIWTNGSVPDSKYGMAPFCVWQSKHSHSIFLFGSRVKQNESTLSYVWHIHTTILYIHIDRSNIIILNITIYI
jgi:hypothetical protein